MQKTEPLAPFQTVDKSHEFHKMFVAFSTHITHIMFVFAFW